MFYVCSLLMEPDSTDPDAPPALMPEAGLEEVNLDGDSMFLLRAFQTVGRDTWRQLHLSRDRGKAHQLLIQHLVQAMRKAGWRVFRRKSHDHGSFARFCKAPDRD